MKLKLRTIPEQSRKCSPPGASSSTDERRYLFARKANEAETSRLISRKLAANLKLKNLWPIVESQRKPVSRHWAGCGNSVDSRTALEPILAFLWPKPNHKWPPVLVIT